MTAPPPRIAAVAAETEPAQAALGELRRLYPCVDPERAEVIVPLGGDGFMLETLHRFLPRGVPIYGMHRGSVGFLMNAYRPAGLYERLAAAQPVVLHPLEMTARDEHGGHHRALAFNEVSLLRESRQIGGVAEFFLATAQHAERRSWVNISLRPIHPADALP